MADASRRPLATLLTSREDLTLPSERLPPVPELAPAGIGVPATSDDREPLVEIDAPRVTTLPAYWLDGAPAAYDTVYARASAVDALRDAASQLPPRYGIVVLDGWRPPTLQTWLYEAAYADPALDPGYVTPPARDPARPAPHTTGGTVDVTLTYDLVPLALGTPFDAFTPAAHLCAFEASGADPLVRDLRRLLYWTLRTAGFVGYPQEWWHYELGTCRWAALTGRRPRWQAVTCPPSAS